jgi:hypothetical protein
MGHGNNEARNLDPVSRVDGPLGTNAIVLAGSGFKVWTTAARQMAWANV